MSVIDKSTAKVQLPRTGPDSFWRQVDRQFAGPDAMTDVSPRQADQLAEQRWRSLAMLALRENAGWPIDRIARAFGQNRGHVSRCLSRVTDQLRDALDVEPSMNPDTQRTDS